MMLDLWDLGLRARAARKLGHPYLVVDEVEAALFSHAAGGVGWPDLIFGVPVRILAKEDQSPIFNAPKPTL